MTDVRTVKPENIRYVTAPLSMEQISEYYADKDLVFVINYGTSELKGKVLMSYMSNLGIPMEVSISRELPLAERKAFVREYMQSRNVVRLTGLNFTVASILMQLKGFNQLTRELINPILDEQEINEFINENADMVDRWRQVMDSMIVFCMSVSDLYVEAFGNPKENTEQVDDAAFIGCNFVHLFEIDVFMETYYTAPGKQRYFVKQFEEYMFKGRNLFSYFMTPVNPLPALLHVLGKLEGTSLESLTRELEEAETKAKETP